MSNSDHEFIEGESVDLVLLSNFVHQVINPLNGIAGTLDNLANNVIKDEHRKEQRLRSSRAQIEQCISLVRNLAYFAQGFQKVSKDQRREILVPEQIIRAAMFYQEDAEIKNISIRLLENRVPNRISGHLELFIQVFMNIFDNAVKYSKKDSQVIVKQWIQKSSSDLIVTVESQMRVPLNRVEIDRIFELRYRGVNARQIVASGTGLGMYICKRIVEEVHDGSLNCDLFGDEGIRFTVRLPDAYYKPYASNEI